VVEVSRAGAVAIEAGGRRITLDPGHGVDLALVPDDQGRWIEDPRDWRDVIISRVREGLPVGRLSVTNLGLQAQPK
jgi:hypothetical protein